VTELAWVIGRGGLLGQHVERTISASANIWHPPEQISWAAAAFDGLELRRLTRQFLSAAGNEPWSVAWCAGAGTVSTSVEGLQVELVALRETLDALADAPHRRHGTFFYASSAGGIYAGANAPPYDESSAVCPTSAYGRVKLEAEALVADWSERNDTTALVGRISNIYGPGQDLAKAQGLISQICRSHLTGRPLSIYVSLDTLRDYLFAPDCARLVVEGLRRLRQESSSKHPMVITKILASQRAITVGAVLGEMGRIFKSPLRIVIGKSLQSTTQIKDLSLRSRVWTELDRRTLTPFPVGVAITAADLLRQLQDGKLETHLGLIA
jgi:UDP-glucose 4-epimerase